MNALFSLRAQGILILFFGFLLVIIVFQPIVSEIQNTKRQTQDVTVLIDRHIASLSRALPNTPYQSHDVFVFRLGSSDTLSTGADIQTALIEILKQHKARLVDLRQDETEETISGLSGLLFTLNYEGDFKAVLDVISALSATEWPLLIERMEVAAKGPNSRPDRQIRISLKLRLWVRGAV